MNNVGNVAQKEADLKTIEYGLQMYADSILALQNDFV
jgi:hypothetical protein